ncbi:MAG: type III pantothenate kinase [Candidatus Omnitrophica bacterium]|nr:type III pantothenate kinase [Candidatus Omnitrophota bacterium]
MLLAIDIGNTNITFGLFKGKRLVKKGRCATSAAGKYGYFARKLKSECAGSGLKAIVICSVVPESEKALVKALKHTLQTCVLILGKDIKVPIKNLYKNPRQVGPDRLVAAYAAHVLYGDNRPLIVIDFGTAVTFDVVSRKGAYLGGLIVPGMEMSLAALSEKAALLPKVALRKPSFILGKTTKESMTSGAFYGYAAMCDGLVSKLEKRFSRKFRVLATGGTASLIAPLSSSIEKVDVDLVLKGVNLSFRKS